MMALQTASDIMRGKLIGSVDEVFSAVKFDSRKVKESDLFFAIRGLDKDGHQYIDSAMENGALAVVMDAEGESQRNAPTCNAIVVDDTTVALGDLARHWRVQFAVPVVGVTGSNGKTTVSRILSEIFRVVMPGIAPKGSFNNQWGVPITLLQLRDADQSAVIEMGMNHPGELSYLGSIARPTIGVITNAAAAHLEGLKTVEGVAKAKGELIQCVEESGCVVLNRDDAFFQQWADLAGDRKILSFGRNEAADLQIVVSRGQQFDIKYKGENTTFECNLLGEHNYLNVAAASAVAICAGLNLSDIKSGVKAVKPVNGRLQLKPSNLVSTLIDDTYNANPASMSAAISVLAAYSTPTTLILGTMGELGDNAEQAHFKVGSAARSSDISNLLVFCDNAENEHLAQQYIEGYGEGAVLLSSLDCVSVHLQNTFTKDVTVLIKGSRAAQMERVVKLLQQEGSAC